MKKKKLLFIAPNYYDFNTVVYEGFKRYSEYEVTHIITNGKYIYKNWAERILNFFSKNFFGRNLKHEWVQRQTLKILNEHDYFDLLVANRPDVLSDEELDRAISISNKTVYLIWDSLDKIKEQKKIINYFDICCSFDSYDCTKYNLKKINNFYFINDINEVEIKFEACYLGTYDQRIGDLIKIFEYLNKNNIRAKCKIFTYQSIKIKEQIPKNIEVIHKIIPFSTSYNYYLDAKVIIDIAHENQRGLSFRPFEAIGLKKKLITNNKEIKKYDFYDPQNIFVIEDMDKIEIPKQFFETKYKELPIETVEKYFIKNWIETICKF